MRSPFPGMDPYLEDPGVWPDFHQTFITYLREALMAALPGAYDVRLEDRICIVEWPEETIHRIVPDLSIEQRRSAPRPSGPTHAVVETSTLTLEPVTIPMALPETVRESRIKILHRSDRQLVTVLELLSPTNKAGLGHGDYLGKRKVLLLQHVNMVEMDLLKGGSRVPMEKPLPAGDYYVFVARGDKLPNCEVYAWGVRRPLPAIRVPLKAPDPDLTVDLAAVFALVYDRGRYERVLEYGAPPAAALAPEDLSWAADLAKRTGAL